MPDRKHLRGASAKEQRQYEHILESAKEEGRYGKRAKEVAARTVMKQHGEKGHNSHSSSAKPSTRSGGSKTTSTRRSRARSGDSRSSTGKGGTPSRSHAGGRRSGSKSSKR